uniref:Uncharacterized protein n=1 Tax=Oryza sativa subsp. japonica TaxID=39947 RepID=Q84Z37_ORYSJ|nr:hypothetical protein [Oryza sativa Japonica Group]
MGCAGAATLLSTSDADPTLSPPTHLTRSSVPSLLPGCLVNRCRRRAAPRRLLLWRRHNTVTADQFSRVG